MNSGHFFVTWGKSPQTPLKNHSILWLVELVSLYKVCEMLSTTNSYLCRPSCTFLYTLSSFFFVGLETLCLSLCAYRGRKSDPITSGHWHVNTSTNTKYDKSIVPHTGAIKAQCRPACRMKPWAGMTMGLLFATWPTALADGANGELHSGAALHPLSAPVITGLYSGSNSLTSEGRWDAVPADPASEITGCVFTPAVSHIGFDLALVGDRPRVATPTSEKFTLWESFVESVQSGGRVASWVKTHSEWLRRLEGLK